MFSIAFCIPAVAIIMHLCIKAYKHHDKMYLTQASAQYKRYLSSKQ